jgi:predicted AAA+ superfamily ATPase
MVQRKEYLAYLAAWREKQLIKVVSGVRRCGKSTLLLQYIDWLKTSGVDEEQIIFINLEDPEFEFLPFSFRINQ